MRHPSHNTASPSHFPQFPVCRCRILVPGAGCACAFQHFHYYITSRPHFLSSQTSSPHATIPNPPAAARGGGNPSDLYEPRPSSSPAAAMEAPFEFKMRTILCLNRNLPYGTTGPDMDFFEAAFEGDIPRLRGKPIADIPTWNRSPLPRRRCGGRCPPQPHLFRLAFCAGVLEGVCFGLCFAGSAERGYC